MFSLCSLFRLFFKLQKLTLKREREREPTEDGSCRTSFRVPLYVRPRIWCDCPPVQWSQGSSWQRPPIWVQRVQFDFHTFCFRFFFFFFFPLKVNQKFFFKYLHLSLLDANTFSPSASSFKVLFYNIVDQAFVFLRFMASYNISRLLYKLYQEFLHEVSTLRNVFLSERAFSWLLLLLLFNTRCDT